MRMGIPTKANGNWIKPTDRESIHTRMARSTRDNGRRTDSMEREWKRGRMGRDTRGSINSEKNMEGECCYSQMGALMMANLFRTIYRDKELIVGPTEGNTLASGFAIRCMAKGRSRGRMEGNTRGIIAMIRSMAMAYLNGNQ